MTWPTAITLCVIALCGSGILIACKLADAIMPLDTLDCLTPEDMGFYSYDPNELTLSVIEAE